MERFGISLDGYHISVGRKKAWISSTPDPGYGKTGIPLCRISSGIKPTTYAMQVFGRLADKNIVRLGRDEAFSYVEGYDIDAECDHGYVLVFHGEDCLGVGFCRDGKIENLLPKAIRRKLIR